MELTFNNIGQYVTNLSADIQELKMLIKQLLLPVQNVNQKAPMDITEAARLINKSKSTIYRLCGNRQIPHKKKGKKLYFYKDELLDWIDNGNVKTIDEIDRDVDNFTAKN